MREGARGGERGGGERGQGVRVLSINSGPEGGSSYPHPIPATLRCYVHFGPRAAAYEETL